MGGQVWKPKQDDEASKREEDERAATWRVQTMLRSVLPSGGGIACLIGRVCRR